MASTSAADKPAHTPGPWREHAPEIEGVVEESYRSIVAGDGYHDAVLGGVGFTVTGFIAPADARLIAAAPDLLAVCKWLLTREGWTLCPCGQPDCATTRLVAAVAKAEGR